MFDLKRAIKRRAAFDDLTMKVVAARCEINPAHLSRLMRHNNCELDTMLKLAHGFNLTLSEFVKEGEF